MAEFVNTTAQSVAAGGNVTYSGVVSPCGCGIRHRDGTGTVNVRGSGTCCPARYRVSFHGTVSGVAGAITLAIYQDGEALPETSMSVVPANVANVWGVAAETEISVPWCSSEISVRNTTAAAISVGTAALTVKRI